MIRLLPKFSRIRAETARTFVEAKVNGGMITTVDAADIENNQFVLAQGVVVRFDRTSRRAGETLFVPLKPDSNRVLLYTDFGRFDGNKYLLRFTPSTIHIAGAAAWTNVVGTMTGGNTNRFSTAIVNDRFFFANGVDVIHEINIAAATHAALGNAPKYKYVTGFFNRVVGANKVGVGPNPVEIGRSGDNNLAEWNPAVDISAGIDYLIESPSDYNDFITGLFGFAASMIILRQKSVWVATKQPSASNPFHYDTVVPGIGCDCPNTAVAIPNGICWYDFRTSSVYVYTVGQQEPQPIGRGVERSITPQIEDTEFPFASYNPIENEYTLCVPSLTSSIVRIWTFNFRTGAWVYDERPNLTAVNDVDYASSVLMVDDLVGMIDDLAGVIDNLGNTISIPSRFYGYSTGELARLDPTKDTDWYGSYSTILDSKLFNLPTDDMYVAVFRMEYVCTKTTSLLLQYRKNSNVPWKTYRTISLTVDGQRHLITNSKNIKARQFQWQLVSTNGLFDILEYEVKTYAGAPSKE